MNSMPITGTSIKAFVNKTVTYSNVELKGGEKKGYDLKARLHRSPRLINAVESTKVNRVNSSFQWKWSTGLTGEQVGDGQLLFNVVDSLFVTHHRLPV